MQSTAERADTWDMAQLVLAPARSTTGSRLPASLPVLAGTAATAGAGVVHVVGGAVDATHGGAIAGTLLVTGTLQLLFAVVLLLGAERLRVAVGWFQAICVVALWASVTVGIPALHPHPDPLDLAKALTLGLEAVAVAGLLYRGRGVRREDADRRGRVSTWTAVAVALVVVATAVASVDVAVGGADTQGHTHADQAPHEH